MLDFDDAALGRVAVEPVLAVAAVNVVADPVGHVDDIVAVEPCDDVEAVAAPDGVVVGRAENGVVTVAPAEVTAVVTAGGVEDVVPVAAVDFRIDTWEAMTEVTIYVPDRVGLVSHLAGAFALSGGSIGEARIFTLKNGMALDVFVISSDKEGLSNAMLEALSLGVPVVSTDVSGARDALAAPPGGIAPGEIVSFEPKALAAAIRRILDDPALRRRMSDAAEHRARDRFDFGRMLDEWERVLRMT